MSLSENIWKNKEGFFEEGLLSHSYGLLSLCISASKNKNSFWKTLEIFFLMFVTSIYCFKNRYKSNHNQLNILNRFLLGLYQKIGQPISGMINILIDLRDLSSIEMKKARESGSFHQLELAYITHTQILIVVSSKEQLIYTFFEESIKKMQETKEERVNGINEASERVRIIRLIATVYFDLKTGKYREEIKQLLEEAIEIAKEYEVNSQIEQLNELLEKIQKETENTAK